MGRIIGFVRTAVMAAGVSAVLAAAAAVQDTDGWVPHFYKGLEAAGTVEWLEKGYKDRSPAVELKWESGARKFGVRKEVSTDLTGCVDWIVTADVFCDVNYGAGASMDYYDGDGRLLGTVKPKSLMKATGWRKVTWIFSTPASAKRYEVHLFTSCTRPVRFANMKVVSRQGVEKGEIPFEVMALPAEWNKDWNGGEVRMQNFTDAPIPAMFYLKGDRKLLEKPVLEVDIPAELEVVEACCPMASCYERLSPVKTAFATNGQAYVRHEFGNVKFVENGKFLPASFRYDEGRAIHLMISPRAGTDAAGKSYTIRYRTKDVTKLGEKHGEEKSMVMTFRKLPGNLRTAKDFYVFCWCDPDRRFATDAVAEASLRAYEAAGIRSYRKTPHDDSKFTRKQDLIRFYGKRPVKYLFAAGFGEHWYLSVSRIDAKLEKELGVRRAVSSNLRDPSQAAGKMCPQYFITDLKYRRHLRNVIRRELAASGVVDGDWVTFDMEPWHSGTWCRCEECHKAFGEYIGSDHVPTAQEIEGPLADKWAQFRCMHNEKSIEIVAKMIREYNPTLVCVDYDYIMPYGDEAAIMARRRICAKDSLMNEKWLDGHLGSYYHHIDKDAFDAMKNNARNLKKFYVPMAAISGLGWYLSPGEVLSPDQIRQFALAAFVNGCPGYAFYSGLGFDGEMIVAMMEAQDTLADYEGLPWGKNDGKIKPECAHEKFAYASTVRPDGTEVVALFNYDDKDTIVVSLQKQDIRLKPYETKFVDAKSE